MAIEPKDVLTARALNEHLRETAAQYIHSRAVATAHTGIPVSDALRHPIRIEYGIKDLLAIAAFTGSSSLMTGKTDRGKTTLAKLAMNAFLGPEESGWHRIDVDNDFGKETYTDTDFSVLTEGKQSSDGLYSMAPWLALPGLIADEINRGHAKVSNKLIHFFDQDISLPSGARAKIGKKLPDGSYYMLKIAAINEGKDYFGTFDIDKALRRRTVIEIPMDVFTPTAMDRKRITELGKPSIELGNKKSHLDQIVRVKAAVGAIALHPDAELFIHYLESFDYCANSLTGEKSSIESRNGTIRHVCTQAVEIDPDLQVPSPDAGCPFLRTFDNELCPNVQGMTPGVSQNLQAVAKGFAVLRAGKFVELLAGHLQQQSKKALSYEIEAPERFEESLRAYTGKKALKGYDLARAAIEAYVRDLRVGIEDIESALPFVAYSKIGISPLWVVKHYQGNRHASISKFMTEAKALFKKGLARKELSDLPGVLKGSMTEAHLGSFQRYCASENPWMWQAIIPYVEEARETPTDPNVVDKLAKDFL